MTTVASPKAEHRGSRPAPAGARIRREGRSELVQSAEYSPFPRFASSQRERRAFTRDLSPSGLCLRVERAEAPGSLLRVVVRALDGRPTLETVARVAWSRRARDGSWRIGLAMLDRRAYAKGSGPAEV